MLDGEDFRNWQHGLPARANSLAQATLTLILARAPEHIDMQAACLWFCPCKRQAAKVGNMLKDRDSSPPDLVLS